MGGTLRTASLLHRLSKLVPGIGTTDTNAFRTCPAHRRCHRRIVRVFVNTTLWLRSLSAHSCKASRSLDGFDRLDADGASRCVESLSLAGTTLPVHEIDTLPRCLRGIALGAGQFLRSGMRDGFTVFDQFGVVDLVLNRQADGLIPSFSSLLSFGHLF